MNIFAFTTWCILQVFIILISIWFIKYSVKAWGERRLLAFIFLLFAILGVYGVLDSIWSAGLF